jgi:prevent-host-death family protein
MREVNVTEFRNHLPKYLSSAHKGSEIWVTSHGQVVARIMPPLDMREEALNQLKELRTHCKIGDVISPIHEDWDVEK